MSHYVATKAEKEQARTEATERHEDFYAEDASLEPLSEEEDIRRRYIGFIGEIVYCNRKKWDRIPKHHFHEPDATDRSGRKIQIKTRTKWTKHLLGLDISRHCNFAVLLRYFKNSKGEECIEHVHDYSESYLQRRNWRIWITQELWDWYVKGIPTGYAGYSRYLSNPTPEREPSTT